MPVDSHRVISALKELRALTSDDLGAQRLAWSPVWLKARAWFQSKLDGLPVEHHYDAAGNSWTTLRGDSEGALVLGSHLDSVPNGGWLDGCLGVLAGLEVLRGSPRSIAAGHPLRFGWSTGPMRKVRASAEVFLGLRRLPVLTRSGLIVFVPIAREFVWRMLFGTVASMLIGLAMPPLNAPMRPLIWNCTSSKDLFSKRCSFRSALCSAPRGWSDMRLFSMDRSHTPGRLL
jgi:hypothetical protein